MILLHTTRTAKTEKTTKNTRNTRKIDLLIPAGLCSAVLKIFKPPP